MRFFVQGMPAVHSALPVLGWLIALLVIALLILAIVALARYLSPPAHRPMQGPHIPPRPPAMPFQPIAAGEPAAPPTAPASSPALLILDERFARGEIDEAEYIARKTQLLS